MDDLMFGQLMQKVDNLEKKVDHLEVAIEEQNRLVNKGKGALWLLMLIVGAAWAGVELLWK